MIITYIIVCIILCILILGFLMGGVNTDSDDLAIAALCCILILGFGIFSYYAGKQALKQEAVLNNAATYNVVVDKEGNSSVEFVWSTAPKQEEIEIAPK